MEENQSVHLLKTALLQSYKEGHGQGFKQARNAPYLDEEKAMLAAYNVSGTKKTIDGLKAQLDNQIITSPAKGKVNGNNSK